MNLQYEKYPFTPVLGWSISRYELFDKCKRQYFYSYYPKYVPDVPHYKLTKLRELTSVPLEMGNVVHDVLEAFLKRLQKSDSNIDERRFFQFASSLTKKYFSEKTFLEIYYHQVEKIDMEKALSRIETCLKNFIESPCYSWIFMVAVRNRSNWMIEPDGFGETRLNGLKAYCKMDFLMPVDDCIYILDWKTGSRDEVKHSNQIIGYAAAANSNFGIQFNRIFPKIVYLYPAYNELELTIDQKKLDEFYSSIRSQTEQMYKFCSNSVDNIPRSIEEFPMSPSPGICRQCRFQELCFPEIMEKNNLSKNDFFQMSESE
jgi:CRISPR/Cas system-associated exonuclease Cas4 (RecB family)